MTQQDSEKNKQTNKQKTEGEKCILNLSKSKHILDAIRYILTFLFLIFLFFFRIEYRSHDITKNFFCISAFWIHVSVEHDENIHSQNLVGIGSRRPEIWPHEYLISPTEIRVNWPGSKQLTRPIYTDFNGLNRYS